MDNLNNILFITLIFSTMLGVLYPLIFEYLYNEKISVGAPFYNSIYIPITIIAAAFLVFSIEINWNGSLSKIKLLHPLSFSIIFAFINSYCPDKAILSISFNNLLIFNRE